MYSSRIGHIKKKDALITNKFTEGNVCSAVRLIATPTPANLYHLTLVKTL